MKSIRLLTLLGIIFATFSCTPVSKTNGVKVAYPSKDIIGEGAMWMPETGKLFWIDIWNGTLHEMDEATGNVTDHDLGKMVGTITPYNGDTILVALTGEIALYDTKSKTKIHLADFEPEMEGYRPNDGKCSPEGRFWIGLMKIENFDTTGGLYMLDHDLSLKKVLHGQIIPNGIVWNNEGNKMFYIDTWRSVIEEYDYDTATGNINFVRTLVNVPLEMGMPDGMTIDDEDNLWVAHWGGSAVCKWNGKTGELIEKIDIDAPNVATCTFGGANQDVLYINSARSGLSDEDLEKYPDSGSLFCLKLDKGVKRYNHYAFKINKNDTISSEKFFILK